ncbi:YjgB family protein [Psychrobacillus sp. AK 1817]|uniref:YjgB family protein n=1 Tax=Psychrobacillus sp. AK 1817 TaxID=2303505 RepID=UPI00351A7FC0
MITQFKKNSAICAVLAVSLTIMVGCSSNIKPGSSEDIQDSGADSSIPSEEITLQDEAPQSNPNQATQNDTSQDNTSQASQNSAKQNNNTNQGEASKNNTSALSSNGDTQRKLLSSIMQLAKQGKIINSEFPVKTTVIEDVDKKLGKAEKVDWVPNAKGNYAVFSKYNVVFGFNKGSRIFEARSFDKKLNELSLSMVKKEFGAPDYDVKSNGEEIIGYVASSDFKILLVFPNPSNSNPDPVMDHYSVFYPKGTVNNMSNDPGRQW